MSDVKDWIWFSKRQVPHFQNETEPRQFPDEYVKYVPKSAYDELKAREQKLLEVIEYQSQVLNKIKWLGHTERKDMYPELTLYRCPTCSSSEYASDALVKVESMMKEIGK